MTFDYKKEYKEFYLPPKKPGIIDIPEINYIAIQGKGDPNEPDGEYKNAMGLLYGIAFTIKMSYKGEHKIDGYFPYVVPPLEGLWYQDGSDGDIDYSRKQDLRWVSMIRLPEFVTRDEFDWAVREATERKKTDFSKVEFFVYREGLCAQCMHVGSYDAGLCALCLLVGSFVVEPATLLKILEFLLVLGYKTDLSGQRLHHEIYLGDPRRTAPEKLRTVIRLPIREG